LGHMTFPEFGRCAPRHCTTEISGIMLVRVAGRCPPLLRRPCALTVSWGNRARLDFLA